MCLEIEKLVNKYGEIRFAEGWAEGWTKGRAEVIFNLMKNANTDFDTAAKMAGWSDDASTLKPLVDAMKEADNQEARDAL